MKIFIAFLIVVILSIVGVSYASENYGYPMVINTNGNPNIQSYTWSTTGTSYARGNRKFEALACFVSGTAGTLNLDMDTSLDGVNFDGAYDDITATGGYIYEGHFNHYQITVDTCSGCSIKVTCEPYQSGEFK